MAPKTFLRAAAWLLRYRAGDTSIEPAIRDLLGSLAGRSIYDLERRAAVLYERELRDRTRPGALEALRTHQRQNDPTILLTSASALIAERVGDAHGIHTVLANRLEIHGNGRLTGKPEEPLLYGAGKLHAARTHARKLGAELTDATFYSDSFSDLPVFEAVGVPIAVNPDRRLAAHARRRGWEVQDWGSAPF